MSAIAQEMEAAAAAAERERAHQDLAAIPLCAFALEHPLRVRRLHTGVPAVYWIENLLTPLECRLLRDMATPLLARSTVIEHGQTVVRAYRSSYTCALTRSGDTEPESPLLRAVLMRVSALCGKSLGHLEALNVVRYRRGQQYEPHHDYYTAEHRDAMGRGGQRLMTFLIYLNSVPASAGGATYFPRLDLRVQPQEGAAAFWCNTSLDAQRLYADTEHAGEPLLGDGEKTALNLWVREHCMCADCT